MDQYKKNSDASILQSSGTDVRDSHNAPGCTLWKNERMAVNKQENENAGDKQKETSRCLFCNKKTLILSKCKCGYNFCLQHRSAESHQCEFDHKNFHREQLEKSNPRIVAEKIKKI